MIGWLRGEVIDKDQPGKLVLNVGGIGYDIETSLSSFFEVTSVEGPVTLHIHTLVREDAINLYGFVSFEERSLFRALIRVNGIGPKLAIAILSSIKPDEFVRCIHQENVSLLTKLPGIGKKTAERLVVEMKDRLDAQAYVTQELTGDVSHDQALEAMKALEALGYKAVEAQKVIKRLDDGQKTSEQLIREGLRVFSTA